MNWNKNHTMRSNLAKFDVQHRVTKATPLHTKFTKSIESGCTVQFKGVNYIAVDSAPVKGSETDNFFLKVVK